MMKERLVKIYKNIGETPLAALERLRAEKIQVLKMSQTVDSRIPDEMHPSNAVELIKYWQKVPMTYAGRLDPMAEGELLILIGDECKNKEKYLGLDKEYEVKIVFGIETDTYDALGLAVVGEVGPPDLEVRPQDYIGKFSQPYPPYSSKTVDGVQLHELARNGELPEEMPTKEVEIYEIEEIDHSGSQACLSGRQAGLTSAELKARIFGMINLVKGDFRQEEIKKRWDRILVNHTQLDKEESLNNEVLFPVLKIRVSCSNGTYMRSLAHRIGLDAGTGAFALSIKRTKIIMN